MDDRAVATVPRAPLPPGWRPMSVDDLPELTRLERASEAADGERFLTTEADLASQLLVPDVDLARQSVAVTASSGALIGWAALEPRVGGTTWNRLHVHGSVHPDARGQGHGRALLDWAAAAARDVLAGLGGAVRLDLPDVLTVHANEVATARAHLHERCGFGLVRWYSDMLAPLRADAGATPAGEPTLPQGYRFVPWSPERDGAFHAADQAAFVDHWASAPWSYEQWRHEFADDEGFRPDLSVGVEHGGWIVGYAMAAAYDAILDDDGRRVAWLYRLGTVREHRGRGLATAVIGHVMAAAHAAGFTTAGLDVDTENLTGAVRLYERLGFRAVKRLGLRARTVREPDRGASRGATAEAAT